MSLIKINESEVRSTDGFSVSYGRDRLIYRESDKQVDIPMEHLGNPYELAVYGDLANQWYFQGKPSGRLNNIDKNIVLTRVEEALSFLGRNFSIRR
ncbi:MAG: hypothetical protein AB7G24_07395 [Novosphingobium sp.]